MLKIYRGQLVEASNGEESDILGLMPEGGGRIDVDFLAELIADDIGDYGPYLTVRYFTSAVPLSPDALLAELATVASGDGDARYGVEYSERTGYLWTNEDIKVGGHDLLAELKSHIGRYLHLEIDYAKGPAAFATNAEEAESDSGRFPRIEDPTARSGFWDFGAVDSLMIERGRWQVTFKIRRGDQEVELVAVTGSNFDSGDGQWFGHPEDMKDWL